jgi:hypothetical protein
MSRVHRFGRSLAIASVALILVAGAVFAHDAVVDPSTASAPSASVGDDLDHFQTADAEEQGDAAEHDADVDHFQQGDDNEQGDAAENESDLDHFQQGDDNEQADPSDAKDDQGDQAEQGDDNNDQGEDAPAVKPATHHSTPTVRHHTNQDGADKNDDHEGDDHEGDSHDGGGDSGGGEQDD